MVTALLTCSMCALAAVHLTSLVQLSLEESGARGELLARAIFQRARVVVPGEADPRKTLREDAGLRAILESSIAYTQSVTYATIVDRSGIAIAHSSPSLERQRQRPGVPLNALLEQGALGQLRGVYRDATLEVYEPLQLGETPFGSIRIGLSTVLIRSELQQALRPAAIALIVTLAIALVISLLLAQWALKPIHVIRAGLDQLGRGDLDIRLELPPGDDFTDLEQSFDAISARLSDQDPAGSVGAPLESVIERLEDAVAILDTDGALLFANSTLRATLPDGTSPRCLVDDSLPAHHPYRRAVGEAVAHHCTYGPVTADMEHVTGGVAHQTEHEVTAHAFKNLAGQFVGIMLVARDIGYLSSVQSTVESSYQVASLGRLLAGVAHEVKNPLNAMTIHLELLKQKLGDPAQIAEVPAVPEGSVLGIGSAGRYAETSVRSQPAAAVAEPVDRSGRAEDLLKHVTIIRDEVHRLDRVIQGFLRFVRPDDLEREAVALPDLLEEVFALVHPEAERGGVKLSRHWQGAVPTVLGDRSALRQALLNLALNACQAMPDGGVLRVDLGVTDQRVVVDVADNGSECHPMC